MAITRRSLLGRIGAGAAAMAAGPAFSNTALASVVSSSVRGAGDVVRLHRNENADGPSPHVIRALHDAAATVTQRYTESEADALRRRIADVHGLTPDHIVLGCGSGELLRMAADTFLVPHAKVIT